MRVLKRNSHRILKIEAVKQEYTGAKLAEALHVSPATMSRMLKHGGHVALQVKVCKLLGLDVLNILIDVETL